MATLGWIGLGEIGTPMALRLVAAGHDVVAWNRSAMRLQPALDAGARAAATPADVARRCEATFVCVSDGAAVEQIVFGDDGLAAGMRTGSLVVDHSTIHPNETRALAARLPAGAGWVDAPVSGGPGGAREGTLAVFLGGGDGDVARVRPWLSAYAAKVTHLGDVGSGQIAKSCNQAVVASTIALWAEIVSYARRCGLDPVQLVDAVEGGWADSPLRRVFATQIARNTPRTDTRSIIVKDLEIVADMAGRVRAPMPIAGLVATLYRTALVHEPQGIGMTSVAALYDGPEAAR